MSTTNSLSGSRPQSALELLSELAAAQPLSHVDVRIATVAASNSPWGVYPVLSQESTQITISALTDRMLTVRVELSEASRSLDSAKQEWQKTDREVQETSQRILKLGTLQGKLNAARVKLEGQDRLIETLKESMSQFQARINQLQGDQDKLDRWMHPQLAVAEPSDRNDTNSSSGSLQYSANIQSVPESGNHLSRGGHLALSKGSIQIAISALRNKITALNAEMSGKPSEISIATEERRKAQQEIHNLRKEIQEMNLDLQTLQSQLDAALNKSKNQGQEIERLTKNITQFREEIDVIQRDLNILSDRSYSHSAPVVAAIEVVSQVSHSDTRRVRAEEPDSLPPPKRTHRESRNGANSSDAGMLVEIASQPNKRKRVASSRPTRRFTKTQLELFTNIFRPGIEVCYKRSTAKIESFDPLNRSFMINQNGESLKVDLDELMYIPEIGEVCLIKDNQDIRGRYYAASVIDVIYAPIDDGLVSNTTSSGDLANSLRLDMVWIDYGIRLQKELRSMFSILPIGPDHRITKTLKVDLVAADDVPNKLGKGYYLAKK